MTPYFANQYLEKAKLITLIFNICSFLKRLILKGVYYIMSRLDIVHSTFVMNHSNTKHEQLSICSAAITCLRHHWICWFSTLYLWKSLIHKQTKNMNNNAHKELRNSMFKKEQWNIIHLLLKCTSLNTQFYKARQARVSRDKASYLNPFWWIKK